MSKNLNEMLNSLTEMKYVGKETFIQIVVNKGKSLDNKDQIFEAYIPVKSARKYFGQLQVSLNRIKNKSFGDAKIPCFWFLLAEEEEN